MDPDNICLRNASRTRAGIVSNVGLRTTRTKIVPKLSMPLQIVFIVVKRDILLGSVLTTKRGYMSKEVHVLVVVRSGTFLRIVLTTPGSRLRLPLSRTIRNFDYVLLLSIHKLKKKDEDFS